MLKKILFLVLIILVAVAALVLCSKGGDTTNDKPKTHHWRPPYGRNI